MTAADIQAIAAFLRVINADFNIGEARKYEDVALQTGPYSEASRLISLAGLEVGDAIRVLSEVRLHPQAVVRLRVSKGLLDAAAATRLRAVRNGLIAAAIAQQEVAKSLLVEP